MTVIDLIKKFLEYYPKSEFGPCHIVLSDYNLSNEHIQWCIGLTNQAINNYGKVKLETNVEIDYMEQYTSNILWLDNWQEIYDDLKATKMFMELLLMIPEDIRENESELF